MILPAWVAGSAMCLIAIPAIDINWLQMIGIFVYGIFSLFTGIALTKPKHKTQNKSSKRGKAK